MTVGRLSISAFKNGLAARQVGAMLKIIKAVKEANFVQFNRFTGVIRKGLKFSEVWLSGISGT